jgi:hypothetical protein
MEDDRRRWGYQQEADQAGFQKAVNSHLIGGPVLALSVLDESKDEVDQRWPLRYLRIDDRFFGFPQARRKTSGLDR